MEVVGYWIVCWGIVCVMAHILNLKLPIKNENLRRSVKFVLVMIAFACAATHEIRFYQMEVDYKHLKKILPYNQIACHDTVPSCKDAEIRRLEQENISLIDSVRFYKTIVNRFQRTQILYIPK
jgi:hypothetical protein